MTKSPRRYFHIFLLFVLLVVAFAHLNRMTAEADLAVEAQGSSRAPSNDAFSGAAVLSFPSTVTVTDIELATIEANEPVHKCRRGGQGTGSYSVWYRFTLNTAGTVQLSTINSQLNPATDSVVSVYEGNSLTELNEVACNDDTGAGGEVRYAILEKYLVPGTYVAKVSYWPSNPPSQPMLANSTLIVDTAFIPNPFTPTPSSTPTSTPSPTTKMSPTPTPDASVATATPTSTTAVVIPSSTPTATSANGAGELIENGGFEFDLDGNKLPDGWAGTSLAKDKRVCNTSKKIIAYKGMCAFRFRNDGAEVSKLNQDISIETLAQGDVLVFSAAVEVTQPVGKAIMLKISYAEPDAGLKQNGKDKVVFKFESITLGYSRLSQTFMLLGTPTKLQIKLMHKRQGTRLMLDALSLTRE